MPGAVYFLCVALRALEHALEPLGEQGLFGFKVTLVRTLYFLEIAKVALVLLHRCLRQSWRSASSSRLVQLSARGWHHCTANGGSRRRFASASLGEVLGHLRCVGLRVIAAARCRHCFAVA